MNKFGYDILKCILGTLYVVVSNNGVERIFLCKEDFEEYLSICEFDIKLDKNICRDTINQLNEYFSKKRKYFDLPINIKGTEFRMKVYKELLNIPYGETRSYSDIAEAIKNEKAVRAVGQANRLNQIPIIIPCHRVIGKNGKMVGYAGDKTSIKELLLELENNK